MSKAFSIDVRGFTPEKFGDLYIKQFPQIVKQSHIASMNVVARTARAQTIRNISQTANIKPQKLIRGRTGIYKANKNRLSTGIYFRYPPMPAEALAGKSGVRWNRKMAGVRVKGRMYEGAFAAQPKTGKHTDRIRVYMRVSRGQGNRYDLRPQYVRLEQYEPILKTVSDRVVSQRLEHEFIGQFKWRLDKAIGKVGA